MHSYFKFLSFYRRSVHRTSQVGISQTIDILARHQPSCIVKYVSKVSDSSRLCACSRIHAPVINSQKGKTRSTVLQSDFGEVFPAADMAIMDVSFGPLRKTLRSSETRLVRAFPEIADGLSGGCSRPVLCGNLL